MMVGDRTQLIERLRKTGGSWLGAAREYLQWNIKDGDRVTWGSQDTITMTVAQFEEAAACIAAAAITENRASAD